MPYFHNPLSFIHKHQPEHRPAPKWNANSYTSDSFEDACPPIQPSIPHTPQPLTRPPPASHPLTRLPTPPPPTPTVPLLGRLMQLHLDPVPTATRKREVVPRDRLRLAVDELIEALHEPDGDVRSLGEGELLCRYGQ